MTTTTAVNAGPIEYVKTVGLTTNQSGRGFITPTTPRSLPTGEFWC